MDRLGAVRSGPALGLAALLAWLGLAERGQSYALSGDQLDLSQRHFRVLANFSDPEAHDNLIPDPDFPGSTGAELAIRKGVAEWGSAAHGSGGSDPSQSVLGSGGANFDSLFSGRATVPGTTNGNTFSVIALTSSILAFTEIPSGDGWRIRFYDDPKTWNDGPGVHLSGSDPFDIQGIACHEYGHALGLAHSAEVLATMHANVPLDLGISHRSLHADDISGVQAIYGPKSPQKPVILGAEWQAGRLILLGQNFDPLSNEIWFTQQAVPALRAPLRKGGIPATLNGTRVEVLPPPSAGLGDVLLRVPGSGHSALSNAWPFDPAGMQPWNPPANIGSPGQSSVGPLHLSFENLPSVGAGAMPVHIQGAPPLAPLIVFGGGAEQASTTPLGTLLVLGPLKRLSFALADSGGNALVQVPLSGAPGTPLVLQAWVLDQGLPQGALFSDGLRVELVP